MTSDVPTLGASPVTGALAPATPTNKQEQGHGCSHAHGGNHHRTAKDEQGQKQSNGAYQPVPGTVAGQEPESVTLPWAKSIIPSDKAQLPLF